MNKLGVRNHLNASELGGRRPHFHFSLCVSEKIAVDVWITAGILEFHRDLGDLGRSPDAVTRRKDSWLLGTDWMTGSGTD